MGLLEVIMVQYTICEQKRLRCWWLDDDNDINGDYGNDDYDYFDDNIDDVEPGHRGSAHFLSQTLE